MVEDCEIGVLRATEIEITNFSKEKKTEQQNSIWKKMFGKKNIGEKVETNQGKRSEGERPRKRAPSQREIKEILKQKIFSESRTSSPFHNPNRRSIFILPASFCPLLVL